MRSSPRRAAAWALGAALGGCLILWAGLALGPGDLPPVGYGPRADLVALAGDGGPLGSLAHPQRRAGPWLKEIPPLVAAAARAAEDRRFPRHPGVDPLAVLRAARDNLAAGRVVSGGSTITMQLARLLRPAPRTLGAKLDEAWRALWLEARLEKGAILGQYLNRAPFGGPLVGIGAASRCLLGKEASRLAPAEAALLMALPQDPARLLRPSQRGRLRARRDGILRAMAAAGDLEAAALARALAAPVRLAGAPPPASPAPHFLRALWSRLGPRAPRRVETHLDRGLQEDLVALAAAACRRGREAGIRQAAILVLENPTRRVLAWVGSPDFHDPDAGQVDGVLARRQPGSALKPFLYALALEGGRTLAQTIDDAPLGLFVDGGTFRPVDYDGRHRGLVSLRTALGSSLNLPALRLAREVTPAALLATLRDLGFHLPAGPEHYGLGLALGDGEVSLLELAGAYAALADGGRWLPPRLWAGQAPAASRRVFSPVAARLVADVLADDRARAPGFGRHGILELPFPAAVKTGTSQNYRDNWCVGFTQAYTVAVWVGNFRGDPMDGVSGVTGAGPLWRQAMLRVHGRAPGRLSPWPAGVERALVCPRSGLRPGPGCGPGREEVFRAGTAPERLCPGGHQDPAGAPPRQAEADRPRLALLAPASGAVYALDPDLEPHLQVLSGQASGPTGLEEVVWTLDGRPLPPGRDPFRARVPLSPGRHRLEVSAREGQVRLLAWSSFLVLAPGGGSGPGLAHLEE